MPGIGGLLLQPFVHLVLLLGQLLLSVPRLGFDLPNGSNDAVVQ
jgi:hypothetical protein